MRTTPHRLSVLAALAAFVSLLACDRAPLPAVVTPITILVDPSPFATIEAAASGEAQVASWSDTSRAAAACTQSFAALELRRWLTAALRLSDADVRLSAARRLPPRGDVFVLGEAERDPLLGTLVEPPRGEARASTEGFGLRAIRRGGRSVFAIVGNGRAGTLYGVYAFVEQLGIRFYGLGDTGAVVPSVVRLPRRLDVRDAPRLRTRGFWAFEPRGDSTFFLWMARNRLNLWTSAAPDPAFLEKLGMRLTGGGHRVQADELDPNARMEDGRTRFAAHPEWYGLRAGVRRGDIEGETGTNFCTSNAAARRELAHNLVGDLTRGALMHTDVVELWPLDGGAWCECDSCRSQGTPSDRWLDVVAAVCAEVRGARAAGMLQRDVEISAPAYLETLAPPTRAVSPDVDPSIASVVFFPYFRCYAHALADPACSELNARLAAAWRGWTSDPARRYQGPVVAGEYHNVSWVHSLPVLYTSEMAADLPWYAAHGGTGMMSMHAPTARWGAWTLNHAVYARLLWNPGARADSIAGAFAREYYGPAAEAMRAHLAALERATRNITALAHCVGAFGTSGSLPGGRLADPRFPVFPLRHLQATDLDSIGAAMREARAALDRARSATNDPLVTARLEGDAHRFDYGEATFQLWLGLIRVAVAQRAHDPASARAEWPAIEAAANRLRSMHDVVEDAGRDANAANGMEASQVEATYRAFRAFAGR